MREHGNGYRKYLKEIVANRATHRTEEEVGTTRSLARAEQILGREYHGRFLIELLQNAADAARARAGGSGPSHVAIRISEDSDGSPILTVANQGSPMEPDVIVKSIGQIGASTKAEGEAIGHKGIGFKSVLELTLTPEIYSGLRGPGEGLSVGFDPDAAVHLVREASPEWDQLIRGIPGTDSDDSYSAIPVLRFPYWVEEVPPEVSALSEEGFDTVVRLPFDERFAGRLGFSREGWLEAVRGACDDVSDQILLLLGGFGEVRIKDELEPSRDVVIRPEREEEPSTVDADTTREVVCVRRNGELSSRWRLFWRTLPDSKQLEGEIAVGLRLEEGVPESLRPAVGDEPSAPFHLFFPTRIRSGMPFLLHAYFQVNAARTGFYEGSSQRNGQMLEELANLTSFAVEDAAEDDDFDMVSLVNLIALASGPEDELAREFRRRVLELLDAVAWIPLQSDPRDGGRPFDLPANVFGARAGLVRRIGRAFPPAYFRRRTERGLPHESLDEPALSLIMERPSNVSDLWETVALLCLPGDDPPWKNGDADTGFRSLLDLFAVLGVEGGGATRRLLERLQGDPDSKLVPAMGPGNSRELLPVPNIDDSVRGRRARLVMARVESSEGPALVPPPQLDVAFLPDGLLSVDRGEDNMSNTLMEQAQPFGVRPFTVDDVLDRIDVVEASEEADRGQLVAFLWRLLARAETSSLGTKNSSAAAAVFDPSKWFWCRPGSVWQNPSARLNQQRRRSLASVLLPCRDGRWRQAGEISFGSDWSRWLEDLAADGRTPADEARIEAYDVLEKVSPGDHAHLAPPDRVLEMLDSDVFGDMASEILGEREPEVPNERERQDATSQDRARHAFLLRLGVWEVPPVEAFQNGTLQNRSESAWPRSTDEILQDSKHTDVEWKFDLGGWSGGQHHNVYLAEDFRFLWPLDDMAHADNPALVKSLAYGARLYAECSRALVFCSGCSDRGGRHTTWRRSSADDGYPSSLSVQLRSRPWVPCTVSGTRVTGGTRPDSAWWHRKPPTGQGLRQSPWRIVPLCDLEAGMNEELRHLAGISSLEDAPADTVGRLLQNLRARLEGGDLEHEVRAGGNLKQAFVGLHRLAYERLADLPEDLARSVVEETDILCETGDILEYRPPDETWHDNGAFTAYIRHFRGSVPFAVIPRDRTVVAERLGVPRFELELKRRTREEGTDVTAEVREFLGDRIPELLAIMVHHSLGTQTLDPQGDEFRTRAQRIGNLRVKQVEDLIIEMEIPGTELRFAVGEDSSQDLFLESATSAWPVLYHDFSGDGWRSRLRRKISPYLARVLENPAYTHTFAQFLMGDEAEREQFLLEIGIVQDEAETIRRHIGTVGEEERILGLRWFAAILEYEAPRTKDPSVQDLIRELEPLGLSHDDARRLVDLGGGRDVRQDTRKGGALYILEGSGFDLQKLHERLKRLDPDDPGLKIRVARDRFRRWMDASTTRLRAVLETRMPPEEAKSLVESLSRPEELDYVLDPPLSDLLAPVVAVLREQGFPADAERLADNPGEELARLSGFATVDELDEVGERLQNKDERQAFLRKRALQWRDELRFLAVVHQSSVGQTHAKIRELDTHFATEFPANPGSPSELLEKVAQLFEGSLAEEIRSSLVDTSYAPAPDRDSLMKLAGIPDGIGDLVQRVLEKPRAERTRRIDEARKALRKEGVKPTVPFGLRTPNPGSPTENGAGPSGPRQVPKIKVDESLDRHRRELGDEGERWALAALVGGLMDLDENSRDEAIREIVELLRQRFRGKPVDTALGFARQARRGDLDEEERIEALSRLLHVSAHSDAFGFDMVGWLAPGSGQYPRAVCVEVKSSTGEGFLLSRGEWSTAESFHSDGSGSQYAVMVVRRSKSGGVPSRMDLLFDPKRLVDEKTLTREADGYQIRYKTSKS